MSFAASRLSPSCDARRAGQGLACLDGETGAVGDRHAAKIVPPGTASGTVQPSPGPACARFRLCQMLACRRPRLTMLLPAVTATA